VFYPGTNDSEGNLFPPKRLDPRSGIKLSPSDEQCIGFNVRTFGIESSEFEEANLVIRADATAEVSGDSLQPGLSLEINDININDYSLDVDGTITNNSLESRHIKITLEIQSEGIRSDIYDGKLDSNTSVGYPTSSDVDVDISDLSPGTYTAVVTATTNGDGVAPVSDSTEFEMGSDILNINNAQPYGNGKRSIKFNLLASEKVTLTGFKLDSASFNQGDSEDGSIEKVKHDNGSTVEFNNGDQSIVYNNEFNTGGQIEINKFELGEDDTIEIIIGRFIGRSSGNPKNMSSGSATFVFNYQKDGHNRSQCIDLTKIQDNN
jgi:hypothetical protein